MSNSDSWETPDELFQELDKEFHFDIDLCATGENSKCMFHCDNYLSFDIHTQLQDYSGSRDIKAAFMNPPYSNPNPFIEKAWEDSRYCRIVALVKCDPSTKWWATFWDYELPRCRHCLAERDILHNTFYSVGEECYNCYAGEEHNYIVSYNGPKPGCEVRFFPKRITLDPPKQWVDDGIVKKVGNIWHQLVTISRGDGQEQHEWEKLPEPSFPSALIIMDRRNV